MKIKEYLKNKKPYVLAIALALLLVATITTVSYAYFSATVTGTGQSTIVTTGSMEIEFSDGPEVSLQNAVPGQYVEKTFKVKNVGLGDTVYDVYLSELINDFVDKTDLVYEVISNDGGTNVSETQMPDVAQNIISNKAIRAGEEHNYTLRITFKETNDNQDDNKGVSFSAIVRINEVQKATRTIQLNIGNGATGETNALVVANEAIENLPEPSKEAYDFSGWYLDEELTQPLTSQTIATKNITGLYAKYTPTVYHITYNYNSGSANNPTTYTVETPTITLVNPTRADYTFTEWSGDATGRSVTIPQGTTGDKTYTANYFKTVTEYTYTGQVKSYTAPLTGTYQLEAYGAQGGGLSKIDGGKGAYTEGTTTLTKGQTIYIAVGGQGTTTFNSSVILGGYNGGGDGIPYRGKEYGSAGGGGATSISYITGTIGNELIESTESQIILIAGGGGGAASGATGNPGTGCKGGIIAGTSNSAETGCMTLYSSASTQKLKKPISTLRPNDNMGIAGSGGGYQVANIRSNSGGGNPGSGGTSLNTLNGTSTSGVRSGDGLARVTIKTVS